MLNRRIWAFVLLLVALVAISCSRNPLRSKEDYMREGDQALKQGQLSKAIEQYKGALRIDPKFGLAYLKLGQASQRNGDKASALDAYRRALDLLPAGADRSSAQLAIADIHMSMPRNEARFAEVEQLAVALCKSNPDSFDGRRLLGLLSLSRSNLRAESGDKKLSDSYLEDAVNEFRIANRVKPGDTQVMSGLAKALAARGEAGEAETLLRAVINQNTSDAEPYQQLYRLLMLAKREGDAEHVLQLGTKALPEKAGFAAMWAAHLAVVDPQRLSTAIAALKSASGSNSRASILAGDLYARLGRADDALREYGIAESTAPLTIVARSRKLQVLSHSGKGQEADSIANSLLQSNPQNGEAKLFRIVQQFSKSSQEPLEQLALTAPGNYEIPFQIARAHLMNGNLTFARQYLSTAMQAWPRAAAPRILLIAVDLLSGFYGAAAQSAKDAAALLPDDKVIPVLLRFAEAGQDQGSLILPANQLGSVEALAMGRFTPLEKAGAVAPTNFDLTSMYLEASEADTAMEAVRLLRAKPLDRLALAGPAPGLWTLQKGY
jgi:tetratricopeptide (TPR) repeat protein